MLLKILTMVDVVSPVFTMFQVIPKLIIRKDAFWGK